MNKIFEKDGIGLLKDNVRTIFLDSMKDKTVDIIEKEINILKKIFGLEEINIREIIEKIRLLTKRDEIYNVLESVRNFIQLSNAKDTGLFNTISRITSSIKTSYDEKIFLKAKIELNLINIDITIILEERKIIKNNYLDILKMFKNSPDSIPFSLKINLMDCQTLREKVGEDDNVILTPNQIIDLEKCVIFMESIKGKNNINEIPDYEFVKLFVKKLEESTEDLTAHFKSYTDNYAEIKKLFDSILDRSEAKRQQIIYICKNSVIIFKNTKENFFIGKYIKEYEKEGQKEYKKIEIKNMDELIELREVALLSKKIASLEENNKKFIKIITNINNILHIRIYKRYRN